MSSLPGRLRAAALLLACAAAAAPAAAELPAVRVALDREEVALGDRVELRLEIVCGAGQQFVPPDLEAWLGDLATEPPRAEPSVSRGDSTVAAYTTAVQAFELGPRQLPPLEVAFVTAAGDTLRRHSPSLTLQVAGVRQEGDQQPRDIKPPVRVPGGVQLWVLVPLLLAVVAVAALVAYQVIRRRRRPEVAEAPQAAVDYAAEFLRIGNLDLVDRGEHKQYYSLLADNLRRYLEERLEVRAMECTTAEVAAGLAQVALEAAVARQVEGYLGYADLVKFAKAIPDLGAARQAPQAGIELVRRIDALAAARRAAELAARQAAAAAALPAGSEPGGPQPPPSGSPQPPPAGPPPPPGQSPPPRPRTAPAPAALAQLPPTPATPATSSGRSARTPARPSTPPGRTAQAAAARPAVVKPWNYESAPSPGATGSPSGGRSAARPLAGNPTGPAAGTPPGAPAGLSAQRPSSSSLKSWTSAASSWLSGLPGLRTGGPLGAGPAESDAASGPRPAGGSGETGRTGGALRAGRRRQPPAAGPGTSSP